MTPRHTSKPSLASSLFSPFTTSKGFALLATLSILSLTVLVALAMVSLSENVISSNSNQFHMEQAKANARLALTNAISIMQEEVGPDQRVTAWSNILDSDPSSVNIEGVQHPYLLGSWNAWNRYLNEPIVTLKDDGTVAHSEKIQDTYTKGRDPIFTTTTPYTSAPSRRFRRWLVSGGEDAMAFSTLPKSGDSVIKLVGDKTLGGDPEESGDDGFHVYAKLKTISKNGKDSGAYAWWVGGENLKASLSFNSAPSPKRDHTNTQVFAGELSHFDLSHNSSLDSFPGNDSERERLTTSKTSELMLDKKPQRNHFKRNYFSYTGPTLGLLTDTKLGGTQADLSLAFEASAKYPASDLFGVKGETKYNGALVDTPIRKWGGSLPIPQNPNTYSSSWGRLFGYHHLYRSNSENSWPGVEWDESGTPFTRRIMLWDDRIKFEYGSEQNSIGSYGYSRFPVIAKYSWVFGLRTVPDSKKPGKRKVFLTAHPIIVLWNPYNVEMRTPSDAIVVQATFYKSLLVNSKVYVNDTLQQDWKMVDPRASAGVSPSQSLRSSVESPNRTIVLPPGETKLFTLHNEEGVSNSLYQGYDPDFPEMSGFQSEIKLNTPLTDQDDVQIALRLGENNNVHSEWPQDNFWWSTNKSGVALWVASNKKGVDEKGKSDGIHNIHDGPIKSDIQFSQGLWIDWIENQTNPATGHSYNNTEIVRDDTDIIPKADMHSTSIVPIGIFSVTMKSPEEAFYTEASPTSPKPAAAKDFRNKNWLYSPPTNLMLMMQSPTDLYRSGFSHQVTWQEITSNIALGNMIQVDSKDRAYIGGGNTAGSGVVKFIANELPTAPITSLAGYGAVPLVPAAVKNPTESHLKGVYFKLTYKTGFKTNGHASMNFAMGIGNGYAHPMIPVGNVYHDTGQVNDVTGVKEFADHWDSLFLSNDGIWDSYFASSIVPTVDKGKIVKPVSKVLDDFFNGTGDLNCKRLRLLDVYKPRAKEDLLKVSKNSDGLVESGGYSRAGNYFGIDGAFNINSTSVEAWTSLLYGLKSRELPYRKPSGKTGILSDPTKVILSRTRLLSDTNEPKKISDKSCWTGIRYLTDKQLNRLAEEIVKQVKLRGPFLNMAEFMNRRLDSREAKIPNTPYHFDDLSIHSALQAAIEWDEFNKGYDGTVDTTNYTLNDGSSISHAESSINALFKSKSAMFNAADNPPTANYPNQSSAYGSRYSGLPTYVMPSDLLQGIGSLVRPRCDTFTVRTYGCSKDESGQIRAEAYCEATIQRTIHYVDSSNPNEEPANDPFGNKSSLSDLNKSLGRKLKVIDFKWLTKHEI